MNMCKWKDSDSLWFFTRNVGICEKKQLSRHVMLFVDQIPQPYTQKQEANGWNPTQELDFSQKHELFYLKSRSCIYLYL